MTGQTNRPMAGGGAVSGAVRSWSRLRRLGGASGLLLAAIVCAGCSASRQSVADLNAGLGWFVSPSQSEGWPFATQAGVRLEQAPTVVIVWTPSPARDAESGFEATRAERDRWISAIREKLAHSGEAKRVEGSPAETFEGGVTLTGLRGLAADRDADLIVLFGLETTKRQYHAFEPIAGRPRGTAEVANVVEVLALAKTVGVSASGVPLFVDSQKGFASGDSHARTVEELEATAQRVAVDALGDAIARGVSRASPGSGS